MAFCANILNLTPPPSLSLSSLPHSFISKQRKKRERERKKPPPFLSFLFFLLLCLPCVKMPLPLLPTLLLFRPSLRMKLHECSKWILVVDSISFFAFFFFYFPYYFLALSLSLPMHILKPVFSFSLILLNSCNSRTFPNEASLESLSFPLFFSLPENGIYKIKAQNRLWKIWIQNKIIIESLKLCSLIVENSGKRKEKK